MQRKGPLPGKIFARCILRRRFAGLFGYMARTSCQSQLVLDAWRANLATKPPLLVRGPFWDTWSEKIATDCRPGTHQGAILPSSGARERISRAFCHRRAAATPQRHVPQHLASRPHRCSRRTPRPCPTCPSLMPPRRPPQRRDAMRRTRRFCRR